MIIYWREATFSCLCLCWYFPRFERWLLWKICGTLLSNWMYQIIKLLIW